MASRPNCVACDETPGHISMSSSALVSKMFNDITGLKAHQNYTICKTCQQELRSCYNFRKRCHEIYELYQTESSKSTDVSSQIFTSPLSSEITIIKSEHDKSNVSNAITFQNKDSMDGFLNEDSQSYDYDDLNPPVTDEDDDGTSSTGNDQDYGDGTASGSGSRFECDECSKSFVKRSRLVAHKAEHRNERLYTCPRADCNSAFNVPHRLTRHLRFVHDAEKEEIDECIYALVEDREGVYIVRNSWLFTRDGGQFTYYPPSSNQNSNSNGDPFKKPDDTWTVYKVKILRQSIPTYKMATRLRALRLQSKNKDLEESEPPVKKQKVQTPAPSVSSQMQYQSTINSNILQQERFKQIEQRFNMQLQDVKNKLSRLQSLIEGRTISSTSYIPNPFDEDISPPKAISTVQEFIDMEQNLVQLDRNPQSDSEFALKKDKMIEYYASKIKNINKRTNPKIGLMGSLMNLYFAPEFLPMLGWTNVNGRVAVKEMIGHISLFFEIVNRNTLTYMNMDEASTSLYTFLRRFHESHNARARVREPVVNIMEQNSSFCLPESFKFERTSEDVIQYHNEN